MLGQAYQILRDFPLGFVVPVGGLACLGYAIQVIRDERSD